MVGSRLRNVPQIQSTARAFAAILADGSSVTWGDPDSGGDSSKVQDQLSNVKQVQATSSAFAAILLDASVVTWGDPACGGDSSEVQSRTLGPPWRGGDGDHHHRTRSKGHPRILRHVLQVQATGRAFAAILTDGCVVTWGCPFCGGDSSEVQCSNMRSRFRQLNAPLLRSWRTDR